jgi:anthranilate synthase/aminodeoxychorismate synthase-like glutamine amidotransferase
VDDIGGTPGKLNVPADEALELASFLRGGSYDTAISYKMGVDHGFSQPLVRLFGALDRWPVVPVFISPFTQPLIAFRRSRQLGEAVGQFVKQRNKRVLIMGSGGISHHPLRYYPTPDVAFPEVYGWQLDGEKGGTMTEAEWFDRLHRMHHEGAQMIIDGLRTIAEMRLNEEFDREFLRRIVAADLESMDDWDQMEILGKAGVGALEIHNWIAARASTAVVRELSGRVPILGICLGHQCIGSVFGGRVVRARRPMHGRSSHITHDGRGLFKGLPSPLCVGRYHSLVVELDELGTLDLMVTARSDEGEIMALAHCHQPTYGVQFHPESILTQQGHMLLTNFLRLVETGAGELKSHAHTL